MPKQFANFRNLILLLPLTVRLAAIWYWHDYDRMENISHGDAIEYVTLAKGLHDHGVLTYGVQDVWGLPKILDDSNPVPTTGRAPLYPAVLSLFYQGDQPSFILSIQLFQAALGTLTVLFVYLLASKYFCQRAATVAGLMMTFAPYTVYTATSTLSETLFSFLITGSIVLWSDKRYLLTGLILGLATLVRSVSLPYIVALLGMAVCFAFLGRETRVALAKVSLIALLTITPWTVRNYEVSHEFIPVNTLGWGSNLYLGSIDAPPGHNIWYNFATPEFGQALHQPNDRESERFLGKAAIHRITANPIRWVITRFKQYPRLFATTPFYFVKGVPPHWFKLTYFAMAAVFFGLGIIGMALNAKNWRDNWYLLAWPVYLLAAQFPMMTDERYSLIIVPVVAIFGAFAMVRIVDSVGPKMWALQRSFLFVSR